MVTFDTILPADTVEFCPHPEARSILACGTYELEKPVSSTPSSTVHASHNSFKRTGGCLIFKVTHAEEPPKLLYSYASAAVVDIKWCHSILPQSALLALATSEGRLSLHSWDADIDALSHVQTVTCAPPEILCLSIDWSNRRSPLGPPGSLAVSLSNGSVSHLQPCSTGEMVIKDAWHAHDHEPWIAAWDYWNNDVLYSGGDDLRLKVWDVRQTSSPVLVNKRFDAGVTSIQSHPYVEHLLAVGSYDDTVRLFDTRKLTGAPLTQVNVGGGAWRVKWHPLQARKWDLLVACMYDGCKVVQFGPATSTLEEGIPAPDLPSPGEITKRFDLHTSIAYGADWMFEPEEQNGAPDSLIASCSFYDHELRLWRA